ncbi:MAG: hypothetical protein EB116_10865 [Betaproteobacteria bacterium]|nr:hypothetical protein [Betaproteobacteria bacterium]
MADLFLDGSLAVDDKFFNDGSRASAIVTFWYPVGDVPVDTSIPEGSNKVLRVQEDTLEFDRVSQWDFNSGFFNVVGTLNGDFFKLNWNAEANSTLINTFRGGGGADSYWLNGTGANTRITDFAVEDKILIHPLFLTRNDGNLFDNTPLADLRPLVNLNFDPARYLTTITVKKLLDKEISTFLLDGYFSGFDVVKDSGLLSIRPSFTNVLSSFPGNALTSSVGKVGPWLVHDMTKPLSLTPYQDVIGFDASKVTSATKVTGFKSGADLLQLSASTAPAGAAISMNLESKQFVAGPGVKQPTAPDQYVLYDTNTGAVYFDQDGNGPSPTWAAMILEAGTALASSDIQISKPQVFRLEADRSLVDESGTLSVLIGSSNVAPNTEVSYSISGISSFDLSGMKLTGSVKLDGNGEALLKLPIAADGITEGTETLTLTLAGQTLSVPINDSSRAASADTVPPTLSAFAPADGAVGVAVNSNLAITFSEPITRGTGSITLKTAAGATVESFGPTSNRITVSGSTLTIDPTKSLDIYSRYVLDLGAGAVQDQAGNASVASNQYDFRTETPDGLYHFFVVAFGAAPGVTYMGQLAEAFNYGLSLLQIVEIFTTKSQFTAVYPETLSNKELATKLVANIIKNSANEIAKQSAVEDIEAAFGIGWTRGRVIYQVFNNLANKPLTDVDWGGTAKQFQNQLAVARYFTETLEGDTTNVGRLQAVLGNVTKDSDVSSTAKLSQLLAQPSFVVSADKTTVNEGSGVAFKVDSYGVAAGGSASYLLSGTNLTSADVVGGSLAGSVTLDSSGIGFISVQFADDQSTEGNETVNLLLQGNVVKTITVLDTSTQPVSTTPTATYTLQATTVSVTEGNTAQFLLTTTNLAAGSSVPYTLSGVSASDVVGGSLTGSVVIAANGQATISVPLAADLTTEGVETLTVTVQGKTASLQVLDTSLTPAATYAIAAKTSGVDEGSVAEFTISTTNVLAGTSLSYSLSGVSASDIVGGALSGSAIVDSMGKATISIPLALDLTTEGTETLTATVQGQSASVSPQSMKATAPSLCLPVRMLLRVPRSLTASLAYRLLMWWEVH